MSDDSLPDDMIAIPASEESEDETTMTPERRTIYRLNETTADTFTKLSYFMREIRDGLPEDLRPAFREIVGAALRAHGDVIAESLCEENRAFMISMAECLTERALDAIAARRGEPVVAVEDSDENMACDVAPDPN